jgi:hypothetical protein
MGWNTSAYEFNMLAPTKTKGKLQWIKKTSHAI